jgi:lantibiotic transport system permease protein
MTLLRVLHAETLKMKRTMALKMVLLAPATVVLLILFLASQAPLSILRPRGLSNEWVGLTRSVLTFWAAFMMPLFLTLESALLAGLDHSENQWKSLLARPVERSTLYATKLLMVMGMTAASSALLVCGILLDGAVLPWLQTDYTFRVPIPWAEIFSKTAQIAGLGLLALTIQYWVSLRWRSFAVPVGVGIVGVGAGYIGFAAAQPAGGWPQYFPWSLPMLVIAQRPPNIAATLWISGVIALVVAVAGCWDFCRREIT